MKIEKKVVILTGSEGLLGQAIKEYLIKNKVKLICLDIKDVKKKTNFEYFKIDLQNQKNLIKISNIIKKKYKSIDALINLACINDSVEKNEKSTPFEKFDVSRFLKILNKNIKMTYLPSQIFGSIMSKQKKGSIINVSSTYGVNAPDQKIYKYTNSKFIKDAAYPVSKSSIISLTKYLAAYWGEKKIRVNVIIPGGIENNQDKKFVRNYSQKTILGRMGKKNELNGVIKLLISNESSYITGSILTVDGGWTAI